MLGFLFLPVLSPNAPAGTAVIGSLCRASHYSSQVKVMYVIDGDTVKLDSGESLRLIGLDTPEIGHEGNADEPGARAATNYLKSLLLHQATVPVIFGTEKRDHYGRLLGHLFLKDGTNIQALLLAGGYGTPLIMPPNLRFLDCYSATAAAAIAEKNGIWSYRRYQILKADKLTPAMGGYRRIRGIVARVNESRSAVWINIGTYLALRIVRTDLKYFTGVDFSRLKGKTAIASGLLYRRKGQARMRIRHPFDLQINQDRVNQAASDKS